MSMYGASVEYGVHCLLHLVRMPEDSWLTAKDVAEFQGVSAPYVAKLFTRLQKRGLLISAEGVGGGYRLAAPATTISVLDVIDALEEDKALYRCRDVRSKCILHGNNPPSWSTSTMCELRAAMFLAESKMREELSHVTLESLVVAVEDKAPEKFRSDTADWFRDRQAARRGVPDPATQLNESTTSNGVH